MPFYYDIDGSGEEGKRTLEGLIRLRAGLKKDIPERSFKERLLLATWNIRDFDKPAYGERMDEAIYYIAEIISHFDIVAVQEVYKDLKALHRLIGVLGGYWKYICTDATEGSHGNSERMVFLYDSRKVRFGGLSGELVLPPRKNSNGNLIQPPQIWRTPQICGFKSGWNKFMLATVHITWGDNIAEPAERVAEIQRVAKFLKKRTEDKTAWSRNLILLGDFNIFKPEDETFQALTDAGFVIPEHLQTVKSNAGKTKHYDQIAFRVQDNQLDTTGKAGVFDYYRHVFREIDQTVYIPQMQPGYDTTSKGKPRAESRKGSYYRTYWRTHQMSDHLPMWVELKIDYADEYLQYKLTKS